MAPFVGTHGQIQGNENGYAGSATSMPDNLDPGLRVTAEQQGERRLSIQSGGVERDSPGVRPELAAEHAVLTQIASAAAAAGAR